MSSLSVMPSAQTADLGPLREFVLGIEALVESGAAEPLILREGARLLRSLIADDRWLPEIYTVPDHTQYRQYLLYRDPDERFSVVSFVWGPSQRTPIHDHGVWGLVGVLRGAEIAERYQHRGSGLRLVGSDRLDVGAVDAVSPTIGDTHRVANAHDDRVTISIHVYGGDIGVIERFTYDYDGGFKPFVSSYADAPPLHLWAY
jgi:predicted metal-dependent enzyme (double-stranded beta helix superfamily)